MLAAYLQWERSAVAWLNQAVGKFNWLDAASYVLVSDYFAPAVLCLTAIGLWFSGATPEQRERRQRAALRAAIGLGFANLIVEICNALVFRERPFSDLALRNLLYQPTDSGFPANPAAIGFAVAVSVWAVHRGAGWWLFLVAGLWSFARVVNGVFYPSDIAAGALVGVAASYLAAGFLRVIEPIPAWTLAAARWLRLA